MKKGRAKQKQMESLTTNGVYVMSEVYFLVDLEFFFLKFAIEFCVLNKHTMIIALCTTAAINL